LTLPRAEVRHFRAFWALAALAASVFIFYQSSRGGDDPTVPVVSTTLAYAGHVALYAVLAFCALTALRTRKTTAVAGVIAAATLFGVFNEAYQASLPDREASVYDELANLLGATLGAAAAYAATPFWNRIIRDCSRPGE
jgi:VanZ family protein